MAQTTYQIPQFGGPADRLHAWLLDAVAEGDAWLSSQRPSVEWKSVMDMLGPDFAGPSAAGDLSNTGYNKGRRIARELVASLSNFRHAGEFKPTEDDAQELFDRAHLLSGLDQHWERTTFANERIREALQFAVAKGTGYLYEDWDRSFWGPGKGDIRVQVIDPSDVTFVQLPKNHDIQQAYVVLIRFELPLNLAKRLYASNPGFAAGLKADRDSPNWLSKGLARVQQFLSPALRTAGTNRRAEGSFPTVDVWHAYTLDGSVNDRPAPITMGAYGTNWSYTVPAIGDPVSQGIRNPATGSDWTLPATPDDCLLFPLRRLTIFARTGVCYDGSSPWWHGDVPLARIRFNDWAWEALGASLVGDVKTMQDGIIALMRGVEDSAAARLDPPALYDDSRVDRTWAEGFNPRKAGVRAGADLSNGGPPVTYPFPPQYYDVPSWIAGPGGWIGQQEERMDYLTAVRDLTAIAKAKQIPGADTLEKLMEMAGPIVQDLVRALEQPLTQLGTWRKAYYFQFYTKARMIQIADPTAAEAFADLKYVPEKLIPYKAGEAPEQTAARGKTMLGEYAYRVTESGINEIHRMTTKLFYLQLMKAGFPISWWTFAQIAQVPNFGPPPQGTNTEMERWVAQKHMEAELQVELEQQVAAATSGTPAGGAPAPEGAGAAPAGKVGGPVSSEFFAPGQSGPGRPPVNTAPARIVTKDGGARSTVTTS